MITEYQICPSIYLYHSSVIFGVCKHSDGSLCAAQLVVLSDRISEEEMDIKQPPIPTLLAVGSVHHHLIRSACTTQTPVISSVIHHQYC